MKRSLTSTLKTSTLYYTYMGFPGGSAVKNLPASEGEAGLIWVWIQKILWRKKWQPIPVFSPGKSHGQRSLATVHGVTKSRIGHD